MKMSIQTGLAALAVTFMAAEAAAVQGVITMPTVRNAKATSSGLSATRRTASQKKAAHRDAAQAR
jgi:hypothetical protein